MTTDQLKFPIGRFEKPEIITKESLSDWISDITAFSAKLKKETEHLTDEQLDTRYRPNGWTIRQVIHHCADSHMNALTRFKLALTEDKPIIKPYFEDRWAELNDCKSSINSSIKILEGVHERWSILLRSLTDKDLERTFIHPEHGKEIRLDENIGMYAWHCNHHLAHIKMLKDRKG